MENDSAERLARLMPEQLAKLLRIEAICEQAAALPVLDDRTPEEIIGYDENGMW
jgi:antitoxin VapB